LPKQEFFFDDIVVQYRSQFIETTIERLNSSDDLINAMMEGDNSGAVLALFLLHIHSIKGQGGTFGFGTVTIIAQKLEDYVETVPNQSCKKIKDIQCFVDSIRRIVENGVDLDEVERETVFAALPECAQNINHIDGFY